MFVAQGALGGKGQVIDFYPASQAGAGTVYIRDRDEPRGTLLIDGRGRGLGLTPLGEVHFDVVMVSGATLVAEYLSVPELRLTNKAVLTHPECTATATHRLDLKVAGLLAVSADSRIDVSGKGYVAGRTSGNITNGASSPASGGSYGGLGGMGWSGSDLGSGVPNALYGDYASPEDWGSGGGGSADTVHGSSFDGAGGGLVRITANVFELKGMLLADGARSFSTVLSGCGSGGGICISVHTLAGTGIIRASGGDSVYFLNQVRAGGGGGRVAIYAADYSGFPLENVSAPGGGARDDNPQGNPERGGAGTVWIINGPLHTHAQYTVPGRLLVFPTNNYNVPIPASLADGVAIQFNKPIDTNSLSADKFVIQGPLGTIVPTGISNVGDRLYRIAFPAQTADGRYHLALSPTLLDVEGFELDQNANGVPGEPDDGYNFSLSLDTVPPQVKQHSPLGDVDDTVSNVDVWFSEAIDKRTLTTSDVSILRPDDEQVDATNIKEVGLNRFRVSFGAQTIPGQYHVLIGPDVQDLAGNALDQNRNGVFGEPTDDVYDGAFNLVEVDLRLSNVAISANQLLAGDSISVTWNGSNRPGAPLLGDWTDAVYISRDDKWDIDDILLAAVPHSGLTSNEIYSASANVYVPSLLPGNYYILVRADLQNQEGSGKPENLVAFGPIPLSVLAFPYPGGSFSGVLTPEARSAYYAINLPGGQNLLLNLAGQSSNGAAVLYIRAGAMPTTLDYDQRAPGSGRSLQSALSNTSTNDQTYYVLVYGDRIDDSLPFNLSSQIGSLFLTDITPVHHGNAASATVTLSGAGFDATTTVDFVGTNGTVFPSDGIELDSAASLRLSLNLSNWPAGIYTVRADKGTATERLPNAFEVVQGGNSHLTARLIVPSVVGFNIPIRQTIWIEYRNDGEISMPAPLLALRGDHGARITDDPALAVPRAGFGQIPGVSDTVQVLGLGSSSTPRVLQPGESGRIPVYYLGLSGPVAYPQLTFTLSSVTRDDARPIDRKTSQTVSSFDPNAKFGPAGLSASAFVSRDGAFAYSIHFENRSDATGPARRVVVSDTLDTNLDLNTLELTEITFANRILPVPAGLNHYEARVPISVTNATGTNNIVVNVQVALDAPTRTLTLTLGALDPDTGWFPADPLVGLLYPNDDTDRGVGSISYLIKPKAGLSTGTRIENRAQIVFDYNDPLGTPPVSNTIDGAPPASAVTSLTAFSTRELHLQWSGSDDATAIGSYDVFVSDNGGNYVRWIESTTNTSATFIGTPGHSYAFYTVARDNAGNSEPVPSQPDTQTTILTDIPLITAPFLAPSGDFVFTFSSQIGRPYVIEVSPDLARWQTVTNFTSTATTIQFVDRDMTNERFYRVSTR